MLANLKECGIQQFNFAGFSFPKHVFTLPRGPIAKRIEHMKRPICGEYYHAPKPNQSSGMGFYLESDGMPALRWQWADEVCRGIRHTGWYSDDDGIGETIRGLVMRLPHGRGFLAGWSMGEGMASAIDYDIYSDEESAAYAADSLAENAAERERDYQRELMEGEESE